jgi:hypothetical protein
VLSCTEIPMEGVTMLEKHISDTSRQSLVTWKTRVTYITSVMWTNQWRVWPFSRDACRQYASLMSHQQWCVLLGRVTDDYSLWLIQPRHITGVDLISNEFYQNASLMTIYKNKKRENLYIGPILFGTHSLHSCNISFGCRSISHYTCFIQFSNQIIYKV